MDLVESLFNSSLGKKHIMAVSGFVLVFFIATHLMGNFQFFFGPEWLNPYGEFLHERHEIIWPARLVLLTMVSLHLWASLKLAIENKAARPLHYANEPIPFATTYASRTILMSGLIIAAFVVYHLLHYTFNMREINLTGRDFSALRDAKGREDIYLMMQIGFSQPLVSGFYVLALALLCLHLSHGMRAMFQSIGWNWTFGGVRNLPNLLARWGAVLVFLLYSSIPVAVLCGCGKTYKENALQAMAAGKEAAQLHATRR
jgi:succinate dehydrogenase / fumarate reductase cytochrome b subunit